MTSGGVISDGKIADNFQWHIENSYTIHCNVTSDTTLIAHEYKYMTLWVLGWKDIEILNSLFI